ncbi:MAG TPA: malto-oligosyltrehalose synthase [Thermoanaerobaculia bacterium]|nr:malto-oligosyltrehalose synthase [Thermoanaerobaculia bacterium]
MLRVPAATYRIQFNAQFTFDDARKMVEYLRALGISDLYASPLLRARKGSSHGYDVIDTSTLNPELGTSDDFDRLHEALSHNEMGLLLDIVPNHMAASAENGWWMSVLENGLQSRFSHFFDIDWRNDKVMLPILGRLYGEALESGELRLGFDADGFFFTYYDKRLPMAPQSYHLVLRECVSELPQEGLALEVHDLVQNAVSNSRFVKETLWRVREQTAAFRNALDRAIARFNEDVNLLHQLLEVQWYRLAYWRVASETINYRRFFDVTDLVGVKVENPEVFDVHHRLVLELVSEGKVTGLRIDHIDGLFDPMTYLTKLQLRHGNPDEAQSLYVVVEKILEEGEALPASLRCAGTSGYDFLDTANALFVDPAGLTRLTAAYQDYSGVTASYEDIVYERKKQIIEQLFFGEMHSLGLNLGTLAEKHRHARDFAPSDLANTVMEVTACMPVYRTYVRESPVSDADRARIHEAIEQARQRSRKVDARLFDFVEHVLLLEPPSYISGERENWLQFVMRWQQFTGRVMAKGVEDTAFYNYNRLLSLNEVGAAPGRHGDFDAVAELHERNERIAHDWPHTMNATSTHDTKRAEDVRARIHVLSELADEWRDEVQQWTRVNAASKRDGVPHANEEWMLYQTLVGMWPLDESDEASVPDRLRAYLEKAAREAKTHSSWLVPNSEYEQAFQDFAAGILDNAPFMTRFRAFQQRVAFHGFLNSLAQVVVKVCSAGVPDFYQGSELWDFSLVDPDNRRPVDYEKRWKLLRDLPPAADLLDHWQDGRIKLFVTALSLAARARNLDAFRGAYRAVETGTPNVVAFTRGDNVLVAVPRLTTQLVQAPQLPVGDVWRDRALPIGGNWRNAFTDEAVKGDRVALRDIFATFPVAILERA